MDLGLQGKRALVTGSSSGIGAEIAEALAAEGVSVVVHGRDLDRAKAVAGRITARGGRAEVAVGDLTTEAGAAATVAAVIESVGAIDILVNNVGEPVGGTKANWFDNSLQDWTDSFAVNTLVAVRMIHAFVPAMVASGWGRSIQISSRNAISPHANLCTYGAAKAAMNNLTLSLSKGLAGTGVTSNGVMPGLTYTPMLDRFFVDVAEQQGWPGDIDRARDHVLRNMVMQTVNRLGQPSDIAGLVSFIASPRSDFLTGTTIRMDGGSTPTV